MPKLNPIAFKTILLIKALKIQRFCFFNGRPLQRRHDICMWWSRSFEQIGKQIGLTANNIFTKPVQQ